MSFMETPRFPLKASYGAVGGPEYATDVVEVNSGFEQRNVRWSQGRAKYTVEFPLLDTDAATLLAWFRSMRGRAHGFRLKDWADYQVSTTTGKLGTSSNATGVKTYQLYKYYSAGTSFEEYRKIVKPVASPAPAIYRGGVLQTAGSSAGNYAIDTTTGLVTFVADFEANATAITVGSSTIVRFATNPFGLIAGKLLYLSGFTGADAAYVNGLAHTISAISGAGPYDFTLSTNTSGKTITLGSGKGGAYAQASETLAWSGEFDVPVRFNSDYGGLQRESPVTFRGQNFELVEIRQ